MGGMGGMSGMGGMGGMGGNARGQSSEEYQIELAKRRFRTFMHSVLISLEGEKSSKVTAARPRSDEDSEDAGAADAADTAAAAPTTSVPGSKGLLSLAKSDEDRDYIRHLAGKIAEVHDMMDDPSIVSLEALIEDVEKKAKQLTALVEKNANAAVEAAAPTSDDGTDDDVPPPMNNP